MNKLKAIREELGLTQQELASKLGISRSQVGNIEQGIRSITPRIKRDLIKDLKVNPNWIKSGQGEIINKENKYDDFELDDKELEFLDLYDSLDEDSQKLIIETMKNKLKKQSKLLLCFFISNNRFHYLIYCISF